MCKQKTYLFILVILLSFSQRLHAAPPTITSCFPTGVKNGTSQLITLTGSWTSWPIQIDSEFPEGMTAKAQDEAGVLEDRVDLVDAGGDTWPLRLGSLIEDRRSPG